MSAQGWDSVTVPGWQVISGLPTVVRYGTPGFPPVTGHWPAVRGGQLFGGGAGGTARLRQLVPLREVAGSLLPAGTRYRLSAWLGGTATSSARVTVAFVSAARAVLARRTIGPVGGRAGTSGLTRRAVTGTLPRGTVSAQVTLVLATSLTNFDGPDAPRVGYDRAVADALGFSVSAPVESPLPLVPPTAHVPRYRHVFVFYFENEDYGSVIGNTSQAPYLNSLLPRASLLGQFFAEEHPSDGNYLALAGGSTFGIPLDDPLEVNPRYTIRARNIGDLIGAAHETWKAYLQGANGPCDDTVHKYYWNDDLPMTYFADVRDRPGYCASHLVPLASLPADLASAASTPNFAWVGPDDCADMEGCGIRAGDQFLAAELGAIMRSPAWRTQRCLAIITFDEDGYDHERPAQRVPTLVLGSAGVRRGYVSHVRYTHYSLLRTIEAALGLGTLTSNDRYVQPVNDIFAGRSATPTVARTRPVSTRPVSTRLVPTRPVSTPARPANHARARPVSRARTWSATPARAWPAKPRHSPLPDAPGKTGGAVPGATPGTAGATPGTTGATPGTTGATPGTTGATPGTASAPPGTAGAPPGTAGAPPGTAGATLLPVRRRQPTAFVVNSGSGTVTPINLATRRPGPAIRVGHDPRTIAITPSGQTGYVVNAGSGTVTPINLATRRPGPAIRVGHDPQAMAITPDGQTGYVVNVGSGTVTPINLATRRPGPAIRVGQDPRAIAITPSGQTAYVLDWGSAEVTPISTATGRPARPIPVGSYPFSAALSPDGRTLYVASYGSDTVTPITVATGRAGRAIPVGQAPDALAVSSGGGKVYAVGGDSDTVTPIATATGHAGPAIPVGYSPAAIAIGRSGRTAYVVNTISGTVTPVSTRTGRTGPPIPIGTYSYPLAITLTPDGTSAVVAGTYAGKVTVIDTRTRQATARITVGRFPVAVAIVG